jgi:tellurite methyltransferase
MSATGLAAPSCTGGGIACIEQSMSAEERTKWDARYQAQGHAAREPSRLLVAVSDLLPHRGRVIDVGGGSGRNAIWLARRGLDVTIVDISAEGLALASEAARAAKVSLRTVCADLETEPLPPGPWDVIVNVHFLLRSLFARFGAALAPRGSLVFAQPTMTNLKYHDRPSRSYLLRNRELLGLLAGLAPVLYREGWNEDGRHEAELLARRPA